MNNFCTNIKYKTIMRGCVKREGGSTMFNNDRSLTKICGVATSDSKYIDRQYNNGNTIISIDIEALLNDDRFDGDINIYL